MQNQPGRRRNFWAAFLQLSVGLGLVLSQAGTSPAQAAARPVLAPILMYHHISRAPVAADLAEYTLTPEVFEKQMAYLAGQHYRAVSVDQVAAALNGGAPLPPRAVAITFDDGGQDNYAVAWPILERYHLFATFFIVTDWVGQPGSLTWDEITEMAAAGMQFGAHTRTHPYLDRLTLARTQDEIAGSQAALAEHLGRPVTVFAYPYGHRSVNALKVVQASGFVAALGTSPARQAHTAAELFYLTRIGVYRWTTFPMFVAGLGGETDLEPRGWQDRRR